jgi:uncharacterized alkaline shock family protein YloU
VDAAKRPASSNVAKATQGETQPRGKTTIADDVVSIIARIAAEQVEGIHQLGESSFRGMLGLGRHRGIESEVGFKEAAVDIEVIVEYGYPIKEVASQIRAAVIEGVEYMTGRKVVEVNVNVVDVYIPKIDSKSKAKRQLE